MLIVAWERVTRDQLAIRVRILLDREANQKYLIAVSRASAGDHFVVLRRSLTRTALPCERGTSPDFLTATAQVTPIIDLR